MKTRTLRVLMMFVLIGGTLWLAYLAQAQPATRNIFRGKPWNYYERGLAYMQQNDLDKAKADFLEAMHNPDNWRMRTYGVHFVEHFPRREYGICLYAQQQYADAEKALRQSIAEAPSARAQYYLEMCIEKELLATKTDTAAPTIEVVQPVHHSDIFINRYDAFLEGNAADDLRVTKMFINGERIEVKPGEKATFSHDVKGLAEGPNPVTVSAQDLTGKKTDQVNTVVVDLKAPVISFDQPVMVAQAEGNQVRLRGLASDDTMLSSVTIGDQKFDAYKKENVNIDYTFTLAAGQTTVPFVATDLAGNEVKGNIQVAQAPGVPQAVQPVSPAEDKTPPTIVSPPDSLAFFTDFGTLEISAKDDSGVKELYVDGKPQSIRPGQQVFTLRQIPLKEGQNQVSLKLVDASGNAAEKTVSITRYVQAVKTVQSRMALSVLPLLEVGSVKEVGRGFDAKLTAAVSNRERFRASAAAPEAAAQFTEYSPTTATKVAEALRPKGDLDAALLGKSNEDQKGVNFTVYLHDIGTGELMRTYDAYDEDKSEPNLKFLASVLESKMENDFPLLEGTVAQVSGQSVYCSFAVENPLPQYASCIIYRPGEQIKDPKTGEVLGSLSKELAEVKVERTQKKLVITKVAKMLDPQATLQVGDAVITK